MAASAVSVVLLILCCLPAALAERVLDMDRYSSCASGANKEPIIVYDEPVILNAHSRSPPPNPPLVCVVMFKSGYTEAEGYQHLEIIIEKVNIEDSQVFVAIFNGLGIYGNYVRNLGKNSQSTDALTTTGPEATVRLTRPSTLYQTAYDVTLKITAYKDPDTAGVVIGNIKLSPGGIIGIVVGLLVVLVLVILVIFCLVTGKIYDYMGRPRYDAEKSASQEKIGVDNASLSRAASQDMSGFDHKDPVVWNTLTSGQYTPGSSANQSSRNFRPGQTRGLPHFAGARPSGPSVAHEDDVRLTVGRQGAGAQWRRDSQESREAQGATDRFQGMTAPGEYSDVYEPRGGTDYVNSRWGSTKGNGGEGEGKGREESPGRFRRGAPPRGSRQSSGSGARASFNEKDKEKAQGEGVAFQRTGSGRASGRDSMRRDDPARSSKRSAGSMRGSFNERDRRRRDGEEDDDDTDIKRRSLAGDEDDEGVPGRKKRRPGSGLFENPDEEGYLYDYDQLRTLSGSDLAEGRGRGNEVKVGQATANLGAPGKGLDTSSDLQTGPEGEGAEGTPRRDGSLTKKKGDSKKKKTTGTKKKNKKGRSILDSSSMDYSDPDAMPPEASEPIFSSPASGQAAPGRDGPPAFGYSPFQAPYGAPVMMPYGMVPMQPGMQTYAYAYQGAAPVDGQPPGTTAGQAAWVVQQTPSKDGPLQKAAFVVSTMQSPSNPGSRQGSLRRQGHPGTPNHKSTPAGNFDTPHRGSGRRSRNPKNPADLSALALPHGRPGDSTPGHKSAIMKAGTDPDTGIHTTQTMWTDTVPDPSDPPPGANPQVTRKTVTRITTRSGHSELPSTVGDFNFTDMFAIEGDQPAFLSPSRQLHGGSAYSPPALVSSNTPERDNVAFYTGPSLPGHPGAPGQVIHDSTRNKAIRDRVPAKDSVA